jgi:hypothetical protein
MIFIWATATFHPKCPESYAYALKLSKLPRWSAILARPRLPWSFTSSKFFLVVLCQRSPRRLPSLELSAANRLYNNRTRGAVLDASTGLKKLCLRKDSPRSAIGMINRHEGSIADQLDRTLAECQKSLSIVGRCSG